MGLDQYLYKKIFIGANWDHRNISGTIELFQDKKPIPVNVKKVSYIVEHIGYWRKCNQIHKWFVDNVQHGEDDCNNYFVSYETLDKLRDVCKEVLRAKDVKVSKELLPTQEGFFYGSTEYDEYYYQELEYTLEILDSILSEEDADLQEYEYSSSW